ncbi:nucleocapsid protein [Porcine respirovirus 2]|nr:nucleocapsid protein [Porcine respirovirus 2]
MAGLLSAFDTSSSSRSESINRGPGGAVIPGQKNTVSVFVLGSSITDDTEKLLIPLMFPTHALDTDQQHSQRTGFLVSLMAMAYSSPEFYLTTKRDNADVKYVIYTIEHHPKRQKYGGFIVRTRDMDYEKTTEWLFSRITNKNPGLQGQKDTHDPESLLQTYGYPSCLGALIIQVWIVLVKAITSSAGLKKGFFNRVHAFRQEETVTSSLVFRGQTVQAIGSDMRSQQSLVSITVETLVTMNTARTDLTTLEKNIQIVGNSIRDAGLASLMNTIRYRVETKTPALTKSHLRPDMNKLKSLTQLYLSKGARAHFICIPRDPVHNAFAPAHYPAVCSYAMGAAVVQNKAMQQYVTGRTYLDMEMFLLGQAVAEDAQSKISNALDRELGITDTAKDRLKHHLANLSGRDGTYHKPTGGGAIEVTPDNTDITLRTEETTEESSIRLSNIRDNNRRVTDEQRGCETTRSISDDLNPANTTDDEVCAAEKRIALSLAKEEAKNTRSDRLITDGMTEDTDNDDDIMIMNALGGL